MSINPKPEDIKNFPHDTPGARLTRKKGYLYVTVAYVRAISPNGTKLYSNRNLGRVVDGAYYPMDDFHSKFMPGGRTREIPEKREVRAYTKPSSPVRRPQPKYAADRPDPAQIENYPHDMPGVRLIKAGGIYYVGTVEYYRSEGRNKRIRHYLGRIKDNAYYTMEEYRLRFDARGRRSKKLQEGRG